MIVTYTIYGKTGDRQWYQSSTMHGGSSSCQPRGRASNKILLGGLYGRQFNTRTRTSSAGGRAGGDFSAAVVGLMQPPGFRIPERYSSSSTQDC